MTWPLSFRLFAQMMLLPEAGQRGPANDVRVCDACSHTPTMRSCARTQRRPFHDALLASTSGLVDSLRARASPTSLGAAEAPGFHTDAPRSPQSPKMKYSVSMPSFHAADPQSSVGDDDVSCATPPTTGFVGHVSAPTSPQVSRAAPRDPSRPVHVPCAPAQHFPNASSRETHLLESLALDEHAHAIQQKFAKTAFYQGLLQHEPAALTALILAAADQLRQGAIQV